MTVTLTRPLPVAAPDASERFRLNRAGILNVWQYDDQEFRFAGGRLLLRGANGAGKSKTLEMLLPFALDGNKAWITASAKHHTSLLWLMTDGFEGQARVGYVWVEFLRTAADGTEEAFTCGVGIRASATARTATAWHFATDRRIGHDLLLEDEAGPLPRPKLVEVLGPEHVFDKAAAHRDFVGRALFGLDSAQYEEVLRLLYWLRQPQVGEDIEPAKLTQQLAQALPQLDEHAVRSAGETFDELTAFGEQIQQRATAAEALRGLAGAYAGYARAVVAERARTVVEALRTERRLRSAAKRSQSEVAETVERRAAAEGERDAARTGIRDDDARLRSLEASPEFRDQNRLGELEDLADRAAAATEDAVRRRDRQDRDVQRKAATSESRADRARTGLREHAATLRGLDERQRAAVPGSGIPVPAGIDGTLAEPGQLESVVRALDLAVEAVQQARSAASRRNAAVVVVRNAGTLAEAAVAAQRQAERVAEQAEARWERARSARVDADRAVTDRRDALTTALDAWAADPAAPDVTLPAELSEESVLGLPALAGQAGAARLTPLREEQRRAANRRDTASTEIDRLTRERADVEAERDPAPPAPPLPRTPRTDGRALWQVIDFRDAVPADARAGLEAALQAAGLLDAWVRPGGQLLDAEQRDVVLSGTGDPPGQPEHSLAHLLMPDLPHDADVTADDVSAVLAAIGSRGGDDTPAWVSEDGAWRLGPAHGRATKERAQYIGATARAHERARRLALIDAELTEQRAIHTLAVREFAELAETLAALERWVQAVPSGQALVQAWTLRDERRAAEEREEGENRAAQQAAHAARTQAAQASATLDQLAVEHDLPSDRGRLEAVAQQLRSLDDDLREAAGRDRSIREALDLWHEAVTELAAANELLTAEREAAADAERRASESQAELRELRESVGASVQELQRRIGEVKASRRRHEEAERDAAKRVEALIKALGEAEAEARNAQQRLAEHLDRRATALGGLAAVGSVPGMLPAAGAVPEDVATVATLAGHPPEEPVAREVAATTDRLAALSSDDATAATTRVWRTHGEAVSGPAGSHQPVVAEYGDLLTVTGRDEAGEAAVVVLAERVSAGVERDRGLLSEREKQQFEQHVLGELGDAIRTCRRNAEELVVAMNQQLGEVSTSQGIRVRLDWKLRDDVPPEARAAVELLGQPVGALLPEERATLRDVLHRLIEASRAERPELSYGEHLSAALDYRTWSQFTIRYTRPEKPGHWERLHRRSELSQGEQKVLCYLPLFAAAAAHFTSLAGAAPYAPRFVLLDDAFPKIDVRTHPLLFGLLVQLDLDFVITSERLWGDHDTVPSLQIYEALRDPNQRGIAQYEYHWDGRNLHPIG